MTREASHSTGNRAAAMMSKPASSALLSASAAHALAAATTTTIANSSNASLALRLIAPRSGAARGAQIESFQAAVQRLPRQPEALRRAADVAARFAQAGLQDLAAEVLRFARRRAVRYRQVQVGRGHHVVASQQLGAFD